MHISETLATWIQTTPVNANAIRQASNSKPTTKRNSPRESVQYATAWRRFEEAHWRPEDGKRHSLMELSGGLRFPARDALVGGLTPGPTNPLRC